MEKRKQAPGNIPAFGGADEFSKVLPKPDNSLDRDFFRIAAGSTAIGLGFMAGVIQSLRVDGGGFYFSLSPWTLAACAIGAGIGLLYWNLLDKARWAARAATGLLVVIGVGGFLYPLRFVSPEKLPDIGKGLTLAACLLSLGATLIWQVKRSLDHDTSTH